MIYTSNQTHYYLQTLFEKFQETCLEIYRLDPAHFLLAPRLAWQAYLKKTRVKLELLTYINMLLMFEQGIREGIFQAIYRYATANNKYMKNYNKNVISSYRQYLDANNLYGWAMCKTLPVDDFAWVHPEDYTEDLIKIYDENGDYGAILEVDTHYPKALSNEHRDLAFLPERRNINGVGKLVTTLEDKHQLYIKDIYRHLLY